MIPKKKCPVCNGLGVVGTIMTKRCSRCGGVGEVDDVPQFKTRPVDLINLISSKPISGMK